MNDTLEKLKQRKIRLDKQIQKMTAAEKTRERKCDTRRKILIGSYYLDLARKNGQYEELVTCMAEYLKRDSDRKLFNLPRICADEKTNEKTASGNREEGQSTD